MKEPKLIDSITGAPNTAEKSKKSDVLGCSSVVSKPRALIGAAILSVGVGAFTNEAHAEELSACAKDPVCAKNYLDVERISLDLTTEELERVQSVQEVLYRYYLNPSFQIYISGTGKREAIDQMMEAAIHNPEALRYKEEIPGVFVLTKRPINNDEVSDNMKIRIENGQLTQVGTMIFNDRVWRDWDEEAQTIDDITQKVFDFEKLNEQEESFFVAYNLEMAHRWARLMELRGKLNEGEGDDNEGLATYRELLESHARNRKGWKAKPAPAVENEETAPVGKINLYFRPSLKQPGVIWVFKGQDMEPFLFISPEGYLLTRTEEVVGGKKIKKWIPEGYADAVKKQILAKQAAKKSSGL